MIPTIRPFLEQTFGMNYVSATFAASLMASSFAISFSHPFDTMKTNLQGDIGFFY